MRAMRVLLQQQHLAGGGSATAAAATAVVGHSSTCSCSCIAARLSSRQALQVSGLARLRAATAGCAALHRAVTSGSACSACWRPVAQQPPRAAAMRMFSAVSSSSSTAASSSGDDVAGSLSPPPPPAEATISSTANRYVKHAVKLRSSGRYRGALRRGLVVGETLLAELADACGGLHVVVLFTRPGVRAPAGVSADRHITVTDSVMKKLTGLEEVSGVSMVAELALPPFSDLLAATSSSSSGGGVAAGGDGHAAASAAAAAAAAAQEAAPSPPPPLRRLLALEGVRDPGNLGTLLRCAAAFGWDAVWLLPGCCDPFNDKALRAARGAALTTCLAAGSLEQLLQVAAAHGMTLLAAQPEPQPAEGQQQQAMAAAPNRRGGGSGRVCLVLGSEGPGLSAAVLAAATPLAVPMPGRMESLNVGVAGAILMFALSEGGLAALSGRLQQLLAHGDEEGHGGCL